MNLCLKNENMLILKTVYHKNLFDFSEFFTQIVLKNLFLCRTNLELFCFSVSCLANITYTT